MPDALTGLRIRHVLREDALGEFLRADDPATGEPVCLRRLHADLAGDESARLLFAEEARRITTLSHPALLRVRRAQAEGRRPFLVTDAIDGGALEDDLARTGRWSRDDARALLADLSGAVAQLEARRQFHAAIHPRRIVRVRDAWRLETFRDVRADDEASRMKGRTPFDARWAAPELAHDHRSGVKARPLSAWSLGALWRWLLTAKTPDDGELPGVAGAEGAAIERLLDPQPTLRPGTAESCRVLIASTGR
jgi:serine/threonine protein kinase